MLGLVAIVTPAGAMDIPVPDPMFVQIREIWDPADAGFGVKSPDSPPALNAQGMVLHKAGDLRGAIRAYEAAVAGIHRITTQEALEVSIGYQTSLPEVEANLGLAYWQLGDKAKAVEAFRSALDARAASEESPYSVMSSGSAHYLLSVGRSRAIELDAIMTLDREAGAAGGFLGLEALLERKGAVLERQALALASYRGGAEESRGVVDSLFPFSGAATFNEQQRVERRELLAQYEAFASERAALALETPGSVGEQEARRLRNDWLDKSMQDIEKKMQLQRKIPELPTPSVWSSVRLTLGGGVAQAQKDWKEQHAEKYRSQRKSAREARASLVANVQRSVPKGAALIEMVKYHPFDPRPDLSEEQRWGAARYGAYVLTAAREPEYVDFGDARALEDLIRDFRHALAKTKDNEGQTLGRRLDDALIRPVRAVIGDVRTLYVAPEGALNLVPFAALVDEQGRYLIERYTFSYLSSGRDLLIDRRDRRPNGPPVVIADPAFMADSGTSGTNPSVNRALDVGSINFPPLPGTAAEAKALNHLLPGATVLTGADATESALKAVSRPRIVHIATHGFFLENSSATGKDSSESKRALKLKSTSAPKFAGRPPAPTEDPMLRSGLVFAGVGSLRSGEDDGVLTALEAAALDLRGTRLVVLSACETGLGDVMSGEGVFGLRRAFSIAGAETLVMSLWQVADEATMELMKGYYARLADGVSRAEALRQTQLTLLKDTKTTAPFYWAAFISSGEAGALN